MFTYNTEEEAYMPNMHTIEFDAAPSGVASEELTVSAQTGLKEVMENILHRRTDIEFTRIPYHQFSRLIDVCCIAKILRDFSMTSLREEEIERFLELQSFFIDLESKCLDEAGVE